MYNTHDPLSIPDNHIHSSNANAWSMNTHAHSHVHIHSHTHTHTHTHSHTHKHTVPESLDTGKLVQSVKKAMKCPHHFCKICATTRDRQYYDDEHAPQPLPSSPSPAPATSTSTTDPLTNLRHLIIIEGTMILNIR